MGGMGGRFTRVSSETCRLEDMLSGVDFLERFRGVVMSCQSRDTDRSFIGVIQEKKPSHTSKPHQRS